MNYKAAYLYLFNSITDLSKLIEEEKENLNVPALLKIIQASAEEMCISE